MERQKSVGYRQRWRERGGAEKETGLVEWGTEQKRLITIAIGIRYTNTNQFSRIDFKLHGKTNRIEVSNNIRNDQVSLNRN